MVNASKSLMSLCADMLGLRVHRLFVVDKDSTLVGIITTMDVLKHLKTEE